MPVRPQKKTTALPPLPFLFVTAALVSAVLSVGSDLQAFSLFSPSTWFTEQNTAPAFPTGTNIPIDAMQKASTMPVYPSDNPPADFTSTAVLPVCALAGQSCGGQVLCCGSMQCNQGYCGPPILPSAPSAMCMCAMTTCKQGIQCTGFCPGSDCASACAVIQKFLCAGENSSPDPAPCTCALPSCDPALAKCSGTCGASECASKCSFALKSCQTESAPTCGNEGAACSGGSPCCATYQCMNGICKGPSVCKLSEENCASDTDCCPTLKCMNGACRPPPPETCQQGFYCGDEYKGPQITEIASCPPEERIYKNANCSPATCSNDKEDSDEDDDLPLDPESGESDGPRIGDRSDEAHPNCYSCSKCAGASFANGAAAPLAAAGPADPYFYHPEFDELKPCGEQEEASPGSALLGQLINNLPDPCPGQPGARCRTNDDCAQVPFPQECFPPNRPAGEWGRCRRITFRLAYLPNQVPVCSNDPKYDAPPWSNYVQGVFNATPGAADPYSSAYQNCVNASVREVACCRKNVNNPFAAGVFRGTCNTTRYVTAQGQPVPATFNGDNLTNANTGFGTNPCANVQSGNGIMYETAGGPGSVECSATNDGTDTNATCGGAYRAVYRQDLGQPTCTNDPFWVPCRRREPDATGQQICIPGVIAPPYLPRLADPVSPTGSKREAGRLAYSGSWSTLQQCIAGLAGQGNQCTPLGENCADKPCCKFTGVKCKNDVCGVSNGQGGICQPGSGLCAADADCCRGLRCATNVKCCLPNPPGLPGLQPQSVRQAAQLLNVNAPATPADPAGGQAGCWKNADGRAQILYVVGYSQWLANLYNTVLAYRCSGFATYHPRCVFFRAVWKADYGRALAIYNRLLGK